MVKHKLNTVFYLYPIRSIDETVIPEYLSALYYTDNTRYCVKWTSAV